MSAPSNASVGDPPRRSLLADPGHHAEPLPLHEPGAQERDEEQEADRVEEADPLADLDDDRDLDHSDDDGQRDEERDHSQMVPPALAPLCLEGERAPEPVVVLVVLVTFVDGGE